MHQRCGLEKTRGPHTTGNATVPVATLDSFPKINYIQPNTEVCLNSRLLAAGECVNLLA